MEVRAAAAAAAVGNGTAKGEGWQRSAVQTFFSWPQPTQPCLEEDVTTVMVVVEWGWGSGRWRGRRQAALAAMERRITSLRTLPTRTGRCLRMPGGVALVADSNRGRNTTKTAPQTSFRGSCSSKGRGGKAVLAVTVASAKKAAPMRGSKTAQKKLPVAVLAAVAAAPCTLHPRRLLRLRSRGFGK